MTCVQKTNSEEGDMMSENEDKINGNNIIFKFFVPSGVENFANFYMYSDNLNSYFSFFGVQYDRCNPDCRSIVQP